MKDGDEIQHKLFLYQFSKLGDIQGFENLKPSDAVFFRFIETLAQGSIVSTCFPLIFYVIRVLQCIAMISLTALLTIEEESSEQSYYHAFLRFLIPPASAYGTACVFILSSISIFLFFIGIYLTKKCILFTNLFTFIFYIFAGELPSVFLFINSSMAMSLLASLTDSNSSIYIAYLIISLIFTIVFLFIDYFLEGTLFNSFFYSGGRFVFCGQPSRKCLYFVLLEAIIIFAETTLDIKTSSIVYGVVYLWFGFHFIYTGLGLVHIFHSTYNTMLTYGVMFLVGAVFAIIRATGINSMPHVFVSIYPLVFIVVFALYFFILQKRTQTVADQIAKCGRDFQQLPIDNAKKAMFYFRCGFALGVNSVINGEFLEYCVRSFGTDELFLVVLRYASLTSNATLVIRFLGDTVNEICRTMDEMFIFWEYLFMIDLKTVTELPKNVMPSISEAIRSCETIPEIEAAVTKNLSSKTSSNFLLLVYLKVIREQIRLFVMNAKMRFPNSLLVLRLFYLYELKIKKDKIQSDVIKRQIRILESDNRQFVDIKFMTPLTGLPEAQKAILDHNDYKFKTFNEDETESSKTTSGYFSSSDTTDDSINKMSLPIYRKIHKNTVIAVFVLVIFLAAIIGTVIGEHFIISKQLEREYQINVIVRAYENSSESFAKGALGVIYTITGQGDKETMDFIFQAHSEYLSKRDYLAIVQNQNIYTDDDFFEQFVEDTTLNLTLPTYHPDCNIASTFAAAKIEYFDQIKIIIDSINESEGADESWVQYIGSMQYVISRDGCDRIGEAYRIGFMNWLDRTFKYTHKLVGYLHLMIIIAVLILVAFIIGSIHSVTKVSRAIPKDVVAKVNIMSNLSKNYPSLAKSLLTLIAVLVVTLILFCVKYVCVHFMIERNKTDFSTLLLNDAADLKEIYLLYAGVASYQLAHYIDQIPGVERKELGQIVEHVIRYFMLYNVTDCVILDRTTSEIYSLVTSFIEMIDDKGDLTFNQITLDYIKSVRSLYVNTVLPDIYQRVDENFYDKTRYVNMTRAEFALLISGFTVLILISFTYLSVQVMSFKKIFDVIYQIAPLVDEEYKTKLVTDEAQNIEPTSHVELIDYLSQPCCITTMDDIIITANKSWLNQYGNNKHSFVGKSYKPFLTEKDEELLIERQITNDLKLVIINMLPEEQDQRDLLEQLRAKMISYRKDLGLERFALMMDGSYSLKFVGLVAVYWYSDEYSDYTLHGKHDLQEYMRIILEPFIDYDILNASSRQTVVVFGVDETLDPDNIVAQAVTFALTLVLRSEVEKKQSYYYPQCVVSCGDLTCTMTEDKLARVDLTGDAINKMMPLIAHTSPGQVTICKETMEMLNDMKFRPSPSDVFKEIHPDMYQFCLEI